MNNTQLIIFNAKKRDWIKMLNQIDSLKISTEWKERFTSLCLDRGFRRVGKIHLSQMQNIADIDSSSIAYLMKQDKKAGLKMLEELSTEIKGEDIRAKAISIILTKGVKHSQKELDLIISMANHTQSLFDLKIDKE